MTTSTLSRVLEFLRGALLALTPTEGIIYMFKNLRRLIKLSRRND